MYKDKIVVEEDFEHLFSLSNNADFSIALYEIFVNRYNKDINSLNPIQLNLFLCMQIENATQADGLYLFYFSTLTLYVAFL